MRSKARLIAAMACVLCAVPGCLLRAGEAAKPSAGAGDNRAADSSAASSAGAAEFMGSSSMGGAMPSASDPRVGTPTAELFVGYSYLRAIPTLAAGNRLVWLNGGSTSLAFNINRYWGVVGDFGAYTNSEVRFTSAYNTVVPVDSANLGVLTYLVGPRLTFRGHGRVTPFVQALFGGVHAAQIEMSNCTFSCTLLPAENTFAMAGGGGVDIRFHHRWAIRVIQAEYLMTRFTDFSTAQIGTQNDLRLSAGIVFRFGGGSAPPPPPRMTLDYSCTVNPAAVLPGGIIAGAGTALYLDPGKVPVYTWSVDGGTVTGAGSSARIDTRDTAPGAYTLKGHVSEGDKPGENADCIANYAVKAFEPPTVSCLANPQTVISGGSSTITAAGISPQNRPLTYSYRASSGTLSGSGTAVTLSTTGATLGAIAVTCTVTDDAGQTASAATSVLATAPVEAARPVTSELCSIHFGRDVRRPSRVDNEAKACLDEVTLSLQSNLEGRLAVVGNASSDEKDGKKLATERAINTRDYLVHEKGIDASRITVYTGSGNDRTVTSTLIPSGATMDTAGDTGVDASVVTAHPAAHKQK